MFCPQPQGHQENQTTTVNPLLSPLSNKPPLFRGGKLISPPSLLSPPSPSPPLHPYSSQTILMWTDRLWFIQTGNSYCFWSLAA